MFCHLRWVFHGFLCFLIICDWNRLVKKQLDWTLKSCRSTQDCWHCLRFCHVSKVRFPMAAFENEPDFEMMQLPKTKIGHFESPGTLLLHVHCWILSLLFSWKILQNDQQHNHPTFHQKHLVTIIPLITPPPIFHIAPEIYSAWTLQPFPRLGPVVTSQGQNCS